MDEIHARYILKVTVQESPVQKPDHAQIRLLQSYLFVIVLLKKLHYSMMLYFLASWSFISTFRLALTFISTLHLPNKYKYTLHKSPMFGTLQMLSVQVHIHGALRSLYTDSETLSCDYSQMNILLFATVGNNQHGGQQFVQFL